MKRHELTEEQRSKVKDLLPPEKPAHRGKPGNDSWVMLNGILYWLNTGIPWRDLPEQYGSWKSVYTRSRRWSLQGVWEHVLGELIARDIVDKSRHKPCIWISRAFVLIFQSGVRSKAQRRFYASNGFLRRAGRLLHRPPPEALIGEHILSKERKIMRKKLFSLVLALIMCL